MREDNQIIGKEHQEMHSATITVPVASTQQPAGARNKNTAKRVEKVSYGSHTGKRQNEMGLVLITDQIHEELAEALDNELLVVPPLFPLFQKHHVVAFLRFFEGPLDRDVQIVQNGVRVPLVHGL